ncbi:hypothetical protein, partial [Salmonella sp. s51090]|uniref:hypothetical protein n=1 Tax=Salmonella sp. s51090 TaxID=3159651 RepID=UPI003980C12E
IDWSLVLSHTKCCKLLTILRYRYYATPLALQLSIFTPLGRKYQGIYTNRQHPNNIGLSEQLWGLGVYNIGPK